MATTVENVEEIKTEDATNAVESVIGRPASPPRSPSPTTARLFQNIQQDVPLSQMGPISQTAVVSLVGRSDSTTENVLQKIIKSSSRESSPPPQTSPAQSFVDTSNAKEQEKVHVEVAAEAHPSSANVAEKESSTTNPAPAEPAVKSEAITKPVEEKQVTTASVAKTPHSTTSSAVSSILSRLASNPPKPSPTSTTGAIPKTPPVATTQNKSTPPNMASEPKKPVASAAAPTDTAAIKQKTTPTTPQSPISAILTRNSSSLRQPTEPAAISTMPDTGVAKSNALPPLNTFAKPTSSIPVELESSDSFLSYKHIIAPEPQEKPKTQNEAPPPIPSQSASVERFQTTSSLSSIAVSEPTTEKSFANVKSASEALGTSVVFEPVFNVDLHKSLERSTAPAVTALEPLPPKIEDDDIGARTSEWWNQYYWIEIDQALQNESFIEDLIAEEVDKDERCAAMSVALIKKTQDYATLLEAYRQHHKESQNYADPEKQNFEDLIRQQKSEVEFSTVALESERARLDTHYRTHYKNYFESLAAVKHSFQTLCARRRDMKLFAAINDPELQIKLGLIHFDQNFRHAQVCSKFATSQGKDPRDVLPQVVLDVIAELMTLQRQNVIQPEAGQTMQQHATEQQSSFDSHMD